MSITGGEQNNFLIPVKKSAVTDWASQSEILRDKYNIDLDELLDIYEMVANFIKRKKRILVGGMAIDYSLRLVGSKLYKVEKIDYDFISPDYHNDAYTLGNEIAKKYDNISVICARHISTMRVRYKFIAVADITYVPKYIFDKINTLNYEGFIIIHPWVQQINQLRAMRNMLEGAPKEMILSNRIEKDTKRYRLLANAYPIETKELTYIKSKIVTIKLDKNKVLTGFPAAIYWLDKLEDNPFDWYIKVEKDVCTISMPEDQCIHYLVDGFSDIDTTKCKKFNPLLDKLYPSVVVDNITYYNIYGDKHIVESLGSDYYIDGFYGTMMWLATKWLFYDDIIAEYAYEPLQKAFIDNPVKFVPNFKHIFGNYNITSTQMMAKKKRDNPKLISLLLPKNSYPLKGESIVHSFDISKSEVLQIDGKEIV